MEFTRTISEGYGPIYGSEYVSTSNTCSSSSSTSAFARFRGFRFAIDFDVRTYGGGHP